MATNTLKSTGGDYSLMSEWEADLPATLSEPEVLQCHKGTTGTGDGSVLGWNTDGSLTDKVILAGVSTSAVNTITITAIDRPGANAGDGFSIRSLPSGLYDYTLSTDNVNNVTFDGLELHDPYTARQAAVIFIASTAVTIENCRVSTVATSSSSHAISVNNTSADNTVYNTVGVGVGGRGIRVASFSSSTIHSCSAFSVNSEGAGSYQPSGPMSNVIGYSENGAGFTADSWTGATNCASSDTTAPGTDFVHNLVPGDFEDYANGNYTPSAGSALEDAGVTVAGITTDITGFTRGEPPEIGAYEIQGGAVKIENMHVKDNNAFVKAAPYVRDGGAWVAVDAYVRDGGAWVQVHEK